MQPDYLQRVAHTQYSECTKTIHLDIGGTHMYRVRGVMSTRFAKVSPGQTP